MKDALGRVQSVLLLGGTSDIGQAVVRRLLVTPPGGRAVDRKSTRLNSSHSS